MKGAIQAGGLELSGVTSTFESGNTKTKKKEKWKKVKLKEVISNPKFLGKTIRLGEEVFEVKGVLPE
jgi:hypothetical protein